MTLGPSAHEDTFARDNLPPADMQPRHPSQLYQACLEGFEISSLARQESCLPKIR